MELSDSSDERLSESRSGVKDENRSFLGIDLNEIPAVPYGGGCGSGQDSEAELEPVEVVRAIHDNPDPAPGTLAEVPEPDRAAVCGSCGMPESPELVVVCDGCERGFHIACVGGGVAAAPAVDWICGDCVISGERSKRWPLGVKSKLILDINSSPPSDVEGDGGEETPDLRKHMSVSASFHGNALGNAVNYSNFLCPGKGHDNQKASGVVACNTKMGLKELLGSHTGENFQHLGFGVPLGNLSGNSMPIRLPSRNPSEVFLQALGDFISERHGILEEGWHVELKHSLDGYGPCAIYCSPNGKTFGSMQEVACYLGLTANGNYSCMDAEGSALQERLHLPKRRKTSRLLVNGFPEQKGSSANAQCRRFPFNGQIIPSSTLKSGIPVHAGETVAAGNSSCAFEEANSELPVQFEDFFVLRLGQVDTRQSYHDVNMIYPIGYKSCWHDRITGSLFTCEISDGGVSGPVFKVNRSSCSELSVPIGSTVLFFPKIEQIFEQNNEEGCDFRGSNRDHDEDINIELLLSDPCPPIEDILSCLSDNHHAKKFDSLHQEVGSVHDKFNSHLSDSLEHVDEIGEIFVEEDSLSGAWKRVSQKLIDACSKIFQQRGTLKFLCKHIGKGTRTINWDTINEKDKVVISSMSKFCCSLDPPDATCKNRDKSEIATLADALSRWLDHDRFGLDADFVKEMIEHLPSAESCSRYLFLKNRSSWSASAIVANGVLLVKAKGRESVKEDAFVGFSHKAKKPIPNAGHGMGNSRPPPGKPLCLRFPPAIIGDFLQVSEVLWRFHEILGLEEPFSLEKLEKELINPLFDGLVPDESGKEVYRNEMKSSALDCNKSYLPVSLEHSTAFVHMETESAREASKAMLSHSSNGRCLGVLLTSFHTSLLQVLMCELQSKVAAFVDPNFDSGESKSRRSRKKDDTPLSSKRNKLHMLPINELTWPELAHRYILCLLSMDGNLESAEIAARESGKVFRCLQGDGGLLCGSLSGVAGMEADAMLLAEATKRILGSLKKDNAVLSVEDDESDGPGATEMNTYIGDGIPEWAQMLEPVRKLPTNVGTRIRKCIYDALDKNPPEWAKKILEHSISKEVYKGNASGPTKKAVLSLLADLRDENLVSKPVKATKKRTSIVVSDIIMKQCRIVLRDVAAADDEKVFCTLLGQKLLNATDNDDEGLLGSPAMVSRPLDFRTIDLRLVAGAYDGSHEAFLEDVHELWRNIRAMYADQPDCVELVETLSQKFEALYEAEVLPLVWKLMDYKKSECLGAEMKKEINDIVASTNKLPKAPWDEGVCKVCGVDKDDDSVLLCDTCDAEYHTYCLKPPLIRIPEGNWYCPSCVIGKRMAQDALESYKLNSRRKSRKYQGEVTRVHLETVAHLAAVMEEKDYWEFSAEERILLLRLLCDELLNSTLVHQHLEQCAEAIIELQQKLRSMTSEWKNMKCREEFLATKLAKADHSILKQVGEPQKSSRFVNHSCNDQPTQEGVGGGSNLDDSSEHSSATISNKNQSKSPLESGTQTEDTHTVSDESKIPSPQNDSVSRLHEFPMPGSSPHITDNLSCQRHTTDTLDRSDGTDPGPYVPSITVDLHAAHDASSLASEELNTTNNDILHLQKSIRDLESQFLKQSIRRDLLGSDSDGRLYWVSCLPDGQPHIVVDESISVQKPALLHERIGLTGSRVPSPFLHGVDHARVMRSTWFFYETDAEIEELLQWLKDEDSKERDLKESILCWRRFRFWDDQKARSKAHNSVSPVVSPVRLVTKAATSLEKRYGPCLKLETETFKKRGKKTRVADHEKLYRCQCMEPILPSMSHCLVCHKTFPTDGEFDEHTDGTCIPASLTKEEGKEVKDSSRAKENLKSGPLRPQSTANKNLVETSKAYELDSGLIRYQDEESTCPYSFEDICSNFVTKDSNKELVKEIGLIGCNGIPTFLPKPSTYLNDSMLMSDASKKRDGNSGDLVLSTDRPSASQGNTDADANVAGHGRESNMVFDRFTANDFSDILRPSRLGFGLLERKKGKSSSNHLAADGVNGCCVVPQASLKPIGGKASAIFRLLKLNLLDMDAALPEEALRPSKSHFNYRWPWRAFVKSAQSIYELVQATIVLEDMIRTEYLRNEWWYWSSLSAAANVSTLSALALRIYSLDAAIMYEKPLCKSDPNDDPKPTSLPDQKPLPVSDAQEKGKASRRSGKKRKEPEG